MNNSKTISENKIYLYNNINKNKIEIDLIEEMKDLSTRSTTQDC